MKDKTALTFVTLGQVVATYVGRPAVDYQAEVARIAAYYGAGILVEEADDCYFDAKALKKRLDELELTEDAEVVSIETIIK